MQRETKINGTRKQMPINQERHISRKVITIIRIDSNIFAQQVVQIQWLEDNIENIIERNHVPKKIIEKIIGQ